MYQKMYFNLKSCTLTFKANFPLRTLYVSCMTRLRITDCHHGQHGAASTDKGGGESAAAAEGGEGGREGGGGAVGSGGQVLRGEVQGGGLQRAQVE